MILSILSNVLTFKKHRIIVHASLFFYLEINLYMFSTYFSNSIRIKTMHILIDNIIIMQAYMYFSEVPRIYLFFLGEDPRL